MVYSFTMFVKVLLPGAFASHGFYKFYLNVFKCYKGQFGFCIGGFVLIKRWPGGIGFGDAYFRHLYAE